MEELSARFAGKCVFSAAPDNGEVGGGSLPGVPLPTWVVELSPVSLTVSVLEEALRAWETPIVGRVSRNQYLLDVRTLTDADWAEIIRALDTILN